ncbi:TVP38/TMEM64 family protein [Mycobacterium haemophilum]|uniref:TVP38/TMEM64 family membrane protein n=1 Tax=Mycobacterium haemophilum TaxID=29311 RepID=A0A0I9VHP0_9MYCO|nr:TVP38/TMEM64 family protein [Mycobacterium haemophilum]KLO32775.1 membrane protein [Mycobacterium haemophilum]KLO37077.1 membrane protein [Mycobacterium haemophilum]KLO43550.1 membrane protein [Mycobacterium haemophilum]KLO55908.1 membrane protein [Mycobacterium haemophilum]
MTGAATCKTTSTLRSLAGALGVAARQVSWPRIIATVVGITVLIAVAMWVPVPTAVQLREWARSLGPWFPLAFLIAHIVVTVVPVPRTAFTLAAGLLFGPVVGVLIAVLASTGSAVLAALLVRAAGWQLSRLIRHRAVGKVDERLRERGWLAVLSLRLIPVVPFSAINYAAGASAVRLLPYALATLAGLLPGTSAVVILGDTLAGHVSPMLYLVSLCTGALGIAGLIVEIRHYRQRHHRPSERLAAERVISR